MSDRAEDIVSLKVEQLELQNYRGFLQQSVSFEATGATVFIGLNGTGKTSVLEALAGLLSWLVARTVSAQGRGYPLAALDIHNGESSCVIQLAVSFDGQTHQWRLAKTRSGHPQRERSSYEGLKPIVDSLQLSLQDDEHASLPLFVYYPVNRAVLDIPERIRKRHTFDQLSAYDDALTAGGRDFRLFFEWFRQQEDLENEHRVRDPDHRDPQLQAVRDAVETLIPGFSNLHVQRSPQRMVVCKEDRELIVNQLSDGEKCLLATVGDLARRLAIAKPGLEQPLHGAGIVLIDEIELHLHPGWQGQIVPGLERTFPSCQFIITTHSPLVLSRVAREQVRIIEDFALVAQTPHAQGRDVNAILFELMGVAPRPEETQQELAEIARLMDREEFDEARQRLDSPSFSVRTIVRSSHNVRPSTSWQEHDHMRHIQKQQQPSCLLSPSKTSPTHTAP